MSTQKGASIIELLIVIAVIAIIGVTVVPMGAGFLQRNAARNKVNELVGSLRVAQINSISGKLGGEWGVAVSGNQIILFQGATFATRNTEFDEEYSIPSSVSIAPFEIVFSELSGNPSQPLTINVASDLDSRTISINEVGVVDVN